MVIDEFLVVNWIHFNPWYINAVLQYSIENFINALKFKIFKMKNKIIDLVLQYYVCIETC